MTEKKEVVETEEVVEETKAPAAKKPAAKKPAATKEEPKNEVKVVDTETGEILADGDLARQDLDFLDEFFDADELAALTGIDNIEASDISIPYAYLIAKDGKDVSKGDIVLPNGDVIKGWGDGKDAPNRMENVTILNIQPVRVYFPTPFKPSNSYICRSIDGKHGAPDGEYAGQACATCEFAQYPEEGGASPCRDQRLLLLDVDGQLVHMQIGGVGMKPFRSFLTQQLFGALGKVRNLLPALKFDLEVETIETDFGPFPALRFKTNPKDWRNSKEDIVNHLSTLKAYKEVAVQHFDTAASASAVQMAAGEADSEDAGGENTEMF